MIWGRVFVQLLGDMASFSLYSGMANPRAVSRAVGRSRPRTSAVTMPKAAKAAQTVRAARKLRRKRCCNVLISADESEARATELVSIWPALTPPELANMAPAIATLRVCPTTRAVANRPDDSPCSPAGAAFIRARVFGDWKIPCPRPVIPRRQLILQTEA